MILRKCRREAGGPELRGPARLLFGQRFDPNRADATTLQTLPGIGPALRPLSSPIVLAALLERVSAHLEVLRDHPLTTRRYYKRVAY